MKAIAYTYGTYNKEKGLYGGGYVLVKDEDFAHPKFRRVFGKATSGSASLGILGEIKAVEKLLDEIRSERPQKIVILYHFDGIGAWPDRKWMPGMDYAVDYIQKIAGYREHMEIVFKHVRNKESSWVQMARKQAEAAAKIYKGKNKPVKSRKKTLPYGLAKKGRTSIERFLRSKRTDDDLLLLRTGGVDRFSVMSKDELIKALGATTCKNVEEALDNEQTLMSALRWTMRGLDAEDAIRKAKLDLKVHPERRGCNFVESDV